MKLISIIQVAFALSAIGANLPRHSQPDLLSGTGPYPAAYTQDDTLLNHTIFSPISPPPGLKLPVLLWAQSGCTRNSTFFASFLLEVASHGFMVIADGDPDGRDQPLGRFYAYWPFPQGIVEGGAWIVKNAGIGKYANVDATRIAAAGHSCGAIQALWASAQSEEIKHIGVFNSGILNETIVTRPQLEVVSKTKRPIFYFLGGPDDYARPNGERDYSNIPASTPKWKGNFASGHYGTYLQPHGGAFAVAATRWLEWVLRGNKTSAAYFTTTANVTGTAQGDRWLVEHAQLDKLKVKPI
ncbi:hypothetical protein WAI453_012829 [Rhynchosporium graminicola]|uniref:Uncharacterized protein n=1 Tax=Rhynchosporium graminicola TaxID=2792576 RepID=A0A1E1L8S0_9HELO|nr:uncharacterized protein RCO7_07148 [Rhynchosporium commune]